MNPLRTLLRNTVLLLIGAILLSACSGGGSGSSMNVTRSRIERSLERTYANRYVALSKINGNTDVTTVSLNTHALCDKGGPAVADEGPGGDWICRVAYVDPHAPSPEGSAKVEMNVHSNDCYTAVGSSKAVGQLNIVDTNGRQVVNPAAEFDGCFDTSSNGTPNGTMIIVAPALPPGAPQFDSALTPPVGLVQASARGHVPLSLRCADGGVHCTGTIDVAIQNASAGTVTYDVPAGETHTVNAQLASGQARDGGIIELIAHEQTPPPTLASS